MVVKNVNLHPGEDEEKFYNMYKTELQNENNTLNQRVIWNIFAQAGLFGAYASILNAPKDGKNMFFTGQQDALVWILPIMAFLIALFTLPVIGASMLYMQRLRKTFTEKMGDSPIGLPPIMGQPKSHALTTLADFSPLIIPVVIVLAWAVLFFFQLYQWSPV